MSKMMLGEILIRKGLISRDHLRTALDIQTTGDEEKGVRVGELIGKIIVKMGCIEPMELVRVLCEQKGNVDFLYSGQYLVEPRTTTWMSKSFAIEHSLMPLVSLSDDFMLVASIKALSEEELKDIGSLIGRKVDFFEVKDDAFIENIEKCYDLLTKRGLSGIRIGEVLVRDNYVSEEDMKLAIELSQKTQRMVGKILIETGKVNELDFFKMLSLQRRIAVVSSHDILNMLDKSLAKKLSKAFCIHNYLIPYLMEDDTVYIVTSEPSLNPDELMAAFNCKHVHMDLATYTDITTILRAIFLDVDENNAEVSDNEEYSDFLEDIPITEEIDSQGIESIEYLTRKFQKITNALLLTAIKKDASDIHIECFETDVFIRYRVDGTLYDDEHIKINKTNVSGVVNVLKICSDLNIAERRLPQGGRFRRRTGGKVYDFRLQTQPTLYGENIVIRLLKHSGSIIGLNKIGFLPDVLVQYERLIKNPSGLILITGPTGSGKTTTLYSTLAQLSRDVRKKILTIEDPIEYSISRIQQSQTKKEIGFGFPQAIRAFLREDPDIMLIGEIRDQETALESLRASQTGHLVFATLHVNNSVETIRRLIDLDMMPGSISSELIAVISQRLAKRNCQYCKVKHKPEKELVDTFYPDGVPDSVEFYKGYGCEKCEFMGHKGRMPVFEFWCVDAVSKKLIMANASFDELYENALENGLMPMLKDALIKVEDGLISLEEIPNVIPYFQIANWRGM